MSAAAEPNPATPLSRPGLVRQSAAAWRTARRELPAATRRALLAPTILAGAVAACSFGLALTWALESALQPPAGHEGASPAAIAASFVVNLAVLGTVLALAPLKAEGAWAFWRTWLRGTLLALAAFAGVRLAPGSGLAWASAGALAALTAAHAAALCGVAGLVACLAGRCHRSARVAVAVLSVLAVTSLFWSRPVLEAVQKHNARAYEAATQAVMALGPVTGVATYWDQERPGFNLVKSTHTYQMWLGANLPFYPQLWPGRAGSAVSPQGAPLAPGLVLGLLLWGLPLLIICDLRGFMPRAEGSG